MESAVALPVKLTPRLLALRVIFKVSAPPFTPKPLPSNVTGIPVVSIVYSGAPGLSVMPPTCQELETVRAVVSEAPSVAVLPLPGVMPVLQFVPASRSFEPGEVIQMASCASTGEAATSTVEPSSALCSPRISVAHPPERFATAQWLPGRRPATGVSALDRNCTPPPHHP